MDTTINGPSTSPAGGDGRSQPAKQKFFQWAVKWFYANMSECTEEKPDAPILACLLQSIGFQLREFEKIEDACKTDNCELKKEAVRVTIECGTSGMRACLEMDDVKCRCPNSDDANDASFWSVTGTGPAATVESTNKVEESGSNLLPTISKDTKKVLNEVINRLLGLIVDKTIDDNQNERNLSNLNLSRVGSTMDIMEIVNESIKIDSKNFVRSHTQPEIAISGMISARRNNFPPLSLVKENISGARGVVPKAWGDFKCSIVDGDNPRPSPPKIASSPVAFNQLCSPLSQLSLQSEEEANSLAEHVIRAHRYLAKAVEILNGRKSPISHNSSINDHGRFLKPRESALNHTGSATRKKPIGSNNYSRSSPTKPTISRPGSSCSHTSASILSTSITSNASSQGNRSNSQLPSKSPLSRRSVDSSMSKLSTTPLSSLNTSKRENNSTIANSSATSKIPGRCKSFGTLTAPQPLKLAVARARSNANAVKKNSTSAIVAITTDSKNLDTSGIQKPAISGNSRISGHSSSSVGILKIATSKNSTINKDLTTRKSIGNPKFGFGNKKA